MANAKPKTTKTKTTKKSTKNKKGLLSNLYFGSRKAQFLIAIISFALIGGGVMVYKSFAATQTIASWNTDKDFSCVTINSPLQDPGGNTIQPNDLNRHCKKVVETSKQSINVLEFTAPSPGNNDAKSTKQIDVLQGSSYRVCILAKASSSASLFATISSDAYPNAIQPYSLGFQTNDSGNYKRYCSSTGRALYSGRMNVTLTRQYTATSKSRISSVEIERIDSPTSSSPQTQTILPTNSTTVGDNYFTSALSGRSGLCTATTNNTQATLSCPAGQSSTDAKPNVLVSQRQVDTNVRWQACFNVRGSGSFSATLNIGGQGTYEVSSTERSKMNTNSYSLICSPLRQINSPNRMIGAELIMNPQTAGTIYINQVLLRPDTGQAAPSTSTSPTK